MVEKPKRNLIDNDDSRCRGNNDPLCLDCLRRMQITIDDRKCWFPYMANAPENGRCAHKIYDFQVLK